MVNDGVVVDKDGENSWLMLEPVLQVMNGALDSWF